MADIPINPVARRVQFTGNTGTGPFAFTFNIIEAADLAVYKGTTKLTITTDYTVSTNADGTGSVTLTTALVSSDVLTILGARLLERTTDFVAGGDFFAASVNEQMDSQVIMAQQLDEKLTRALKVNPGDEFTDLELPLKADRKGTVLGFNETTGDPEPGPNISDVSTLAAITADIATLADIEDGTDATDAIQTVAGIASNVTTVAGISGSVSTVAGISSDVTTVAADGTDIGTVSTNIADVNTVAGSIASVNLNATNIAVIQDASANATAAASSASSASTSATAAATSATAAAASASSASASADAALTALDNFDDRYLGQKASDPTLDNDGNALIAGALYFNTTDSVMKVYEGSVWVAAYASLSGALLVANNLSDLTDAAAGRTNLGLGTAATTDSTAYATAAQGALADSAVQDASYVHTDNNYTTTEKSKLAGIEAGATADQTAAEILTAIKTVDGAGSGLDADTLDGIQGANFLRSDTSDTMNGTLTATAFVGDGSGLTNLPAASKTYIPFLITSSGTFVSQGSGTLEVYAVGGGGTGAAQDAGQEGSCGGGGAGGTAFKEIAISKNDVITVTVGAGASGVSVTNYANGNTGGTTTVTGPNLALTATGGAGGIYKFNVANQLASGGAGGVGSGGTINLTGGRGGDATNTDGASGAAGGGGMINFDGFPNMTSGLSSLNGTDVVTAGYVPSLGANNAAVQTIADKKFLYGWAGFTDPSYLPQSGTGNATQFSSSSSYSVFSGSGTLGCGGGGAYAINTNSGQNAWSGNGGDGFCLIIAKYNN